MSTVTVTLKHPIQAEGETVSELSLRRATVKDLKAFDREPGGIASMASIIGALGALPPSAVDALDAEDFMALSVVVNGFLGNTPPTGGT